MKVFFTQHSWLPVRYEGANVYHHELAKIMLSWGWDVSVCCDVCKESYEFEGIKIYPFDQHVVMTNWCDICVSSVMHHYRVKTKPVFVIKHSMNNEPQNSFAGKAVIFCADHVRKLGTYGAAKTFVWHPMNRYEGTQLRGRPDGYIGMINCNLNKGGERLIQLAKMMPDTMFLVVLGAYDKQIMDDTLPNVLYRKSAPEMADYYTQMSALLILSHKEGCPTVAQEAMSFGLPVISYQLDGVKEVCGNNAIYCNGLSDVKTAIESEPAFIEPPVLKRDYEGLKQFFNIKH